MTWAAPVFALLALMLAGCSNYVLGTGKSLEFRTLFIEPVENDSNLPQAVAVISTQLREAFLRDGRVTLVNSAADADAVLSVTLSSYGHGAGERHRVGAQIRSLIGGSSHSAHAFVG
ncbi:MAG TPA: LPS assembly lipoprotein LptE [Opitutaceae bacterium]|nr:LPS assembly lipoprotein LptE [Opitutaceae bacterium]